MPKGRSPSMRKRIAIAIVEHDPLTCKALFHLLRRAKWVRMVAAYPNAESALRGVSRERPDVILVDLELPRRSALSCLPALKARVAGLKVVALAGRHELDRVFQAFTAGADACVSKEESGAQFVQSLLNFCHGGTPLSGKVAAQIVACLRGRTPRPFEARGRPKPVGEPTAGADRQVSPTGRFMERSTGVGAMPKLTSREHEILGQLARGLSAKEMAGQLRIAESTVNDHLKNIYRKLHVHSRAQAVAQYMSPGS